MGVQVDQAGGDELAAGLDGVDRPRGRDVWFDGFDHAKADADVPLGPEGLARVDDLAAFDDEVELIIRANGGVRWGGPTAQRRGCGGSKGELETTAAR